MNVMRKTVSEGVCEQIKTWLGGSRRRSEVRSTFRPVLESLERRDVPSATGLDPAQLQAGLNYLGQVAQQQTAILQQDMNVLMQDVQLGQTAQIGTAVQQLQQDFGAEVQALTAAFNAVLSGNIPSQVPPATTQAQTQAPATASQQINGATASDPTLGGLTSSPNSSSPRLISERISLPSTSSTDASQTSMDSTDTSLLNWLYQNYNPSTPSYDPFASSANWWTPYNDWGIVASGNLYDSAAGNLFSDMPIADGYAGPGSD